MESIEYRKVSAEFLGWHIKHSSYDGDSWWETTETGDEYRCSVKNWWPEADANQMLMVWERLRKQGYEVSCELNPEGNNVTINKWGTTQNIENNEYFSENGDNVLIATMEAFMEYIKTK